MTNESKSFWQNYAELKDAVNKIEAMTEPDVDHLVRLVEKGMEAKNACIDRIEAVEKMLNAINKQGE